MPCPFSAKRPLFCYRSDRIKDAALKPPETWKDVETQAQFFATKLAAPSLPPLPKDDDGLERMFYTIAAGYVHRADNQAASTGAFAFHYDLAGNPRIDGPGFVRALALMQRLQKYRDQSDKKPIEAFRDGVGVFCMTDVAQVYRLQDAKSALRDKFAVTRMPAAEVYFAQTARVGDEPIANVNWMPYLGAGGWVGVVPRTTAHAEEAFSLLAELGGRDVSRQVVLSPRSRTSAQRRGHSFRSFQQHRSLGSLRPRRPRHHGLETGCAADIGTPRSGEPRLPVADSE